MFPVDDVEWRKWMNQHFYAREGISFAEMADAQREAAFGLIRASLTGRAKHTNTTSLFAGLVAHSRNLVLSFSHDSENPFPN
jgi:hypothetical protein